MNNQAKRETNEERNKRIQKNLSKYGKHETSQEYLKRKEKEKRIKEKKRIREEVERRRKEQKIKKIQKEIEGRLDAIRHKFNQCERRNQLYDQKVILSDILNDSNFDLYKIVCLTDACLTYASEIFGRDKSQIKLPKNLVHLLLDGFAMCSKKLLKLFALYDKLSVLTIENNSHVEWCYRLCNRVDEEILTYKLPSTIKTIISRDTSFVGFALDMDTVETIILSPSLAEASRGLDIDIFQEKINVVKDEQAFEEYHHYSYGIVWFPHLHYQFPNRVKREVKEFVCTQSKAKNFPRDIVMLILQFVSTTS